MGRENGSSTVCHNRLSRGSTVICVCEPMPKKDKAVGDTEPMQARPFPPASDVRWDDTYAAGPGKRHMAIQTSDGIVDVHAHPTGYAPHDMAVQGSLVASLRHHVELMDVAGISGALVMPIPTRIKDERVWSGRSAVDPDHLHAPSYYTDPAIRTGETQLDANRAAELRTVRQVYGKHLICTVAPA